MDMDKIHGTTTGGSVTSDRRGGDIVPVPPPSSSSDGRPEESPAGSSGNSATAAVVIHHWEELRIRLGIEKSPNAKDCEVPSHASKEDIKDGNESAADTYPDGIPKIMDDKPIDTVGHEELATFATEAMENLEELRKKKCRNLGGQDKKELRLQIELCTTVVDEYIRRAEYFSMMWHNHLTDARKWRNYGRRLYEVSNRLVKDYCDQQRKLFEVDRSKEQVEAKLAEAVREVDELRARLKEMEGSSWNLPEAELKMEVDPPTSRNTVDVVGVRERPPVRNVATETNPFLGPGIPVAPAGGRIEERARRGRTRPKRREQPLAVVTRARSPPRRFVPITGQYREELVYERPPPGRREPMAGDREEPGRAPPWKTVPPARRRRGGSGTRRQPLRAVVAIRMGDAPGGSPSYAEILRDTRGKIPLNELGIAETSVRRAADGGLLVEVRDPVEGGAKADALAERFRSLLPNASVRRPVKIGRIRLIGFDESVLPVDVQEALAACTKCRPSDIRVGPIFGSFRGIGAVTVRLPMEAAEAAAEIGRVALGWSFARIELRAEGPLQCHKCWQYGHVRARCSGVDRSSKCYNCGGDGHAARECTESASCAACKDNGWEARHRMGGPSCRASQEARAAGPSSRRRGRWTRGRPPASVGGRGEGPGSGAGDGAWITGGRRSLSPAHISVPRAGEAMEGVARTDPVRECPAPLSPRASKRRKRGGE